MYVHNEKVQTLPIRAAFMNFLKYLLEVQMKNNTDGVILVAHNGFR